MNAMTDMALIERADTSTASLLLNPEHMRSLVEFADIMASGVATVPKHLRKNRGDCLAVTIQAAQWKMNPFAVAQKTHLVNDILGYEAQLVISVINNSPALATRIDWEWFGPWEKIVGKFKEVESKTKKDDDGYPKKYIVPDWKQTDEHGLGVRAFATIKGESAPRVLELLMTQARTRNSPLWAEDPKQQLGYLAAKRWARLHVPDVLLGVYTPDELEKTRPALDMGMAETVVVDQPPSHPQAAELTEWPAESFEAQFTRWEKAIQAGIKSTDDILGLARTKGSLSADQEARIRNVAKADATDVQPITEGQAE